MAPTRLWFASLKSIPAAGQLRTQTFLLAVMFAIGLLSARYRRKQTTVQSPLTSVLVSVVSFAVVLLAMILTRRLGY